MNTFILYIQDDENHDGRVKLSAEVIGDPQFAMQLGEAVFLSMLNHPSVTPDDGSIYTAAPTTEHAQ